MSFGSNLKKIRHDNNLTQEELAKKINTSRSNIANYENDKNMPSVEILEKLSSTFACSIDYLMGLTSYKNPKEDLEKELYKLNLTEDEFNKMISLLTDKNNDNINNVLKTTTNLAFACEKCLDLILDYSNESNDTLYQHTNKLTNIIKSLDKNKIIHNFKDTNSNNNIANTTQFYMCPVYGRISAGQPNWAEECIEGRIPIDPDYMNITEPTECFFLKVNGESMNKEIKNGAYALIRRTDFVENGEIAVVLVNGYDATLKKFSQQGDLVILEPMSNEPSFTTQVYGKDTEIKILGKYIGKMEMK